MAPVVFGVVAGVADAAADSIGLSGDAMTAVITTVAVLIALAVVGSLIRRQRRSSEAEAHDRAAGGSEQAPPPQSPPPRVSPPPSRGGVPRGLRTEPEDEDARRLKERLAEAVSDLGDTVESMPEAGDRRPGSAGLSSDEMIARAKERIRSWDRTQRG